MTVRCPGWLKRQQILNKMLQIASEVFSALQPHMVVAGLKLPITEKEGQYFTPDPGNPEYEFCIVGKAFVATTYARPTPACSVFDFLTLCFGSEEEAIDYAIAEYHNLATIGPGMSLASIRDQMIQSIKDQRKEFEEIFALGAPLRSC